MSKILQLFRRTHFGLAPCPRHLRHLRRCRGGGCNGAAGLAGRAARGGELQDMAADVVEEWGLHA